MTQVPDSDKPVLRCVSCGFDLRHIDLSANCPECGKSIADTLSGDAVERTNPTWAMDMARGIMWYVYYLIAAIIYMVLALAGVVVAVALQVASMKPGGPPPGQNAPSMVAFHVVNSVGGFMFVIAYMVIVERMTRKEPDRLPPLRPYEPWRLASRLCIPVVFLFYLTATTLQLYEILNPPATPLTPGQVSGAMVLVMFLSLLASVVWGILMYATVVIPADLAMRIQAKKLENQARRIVYYFYALWGSLVAMTLLSAASFGLVYATSKPEFMMVNCFSCVLLIAMFGFGLALIIETFMCYPKIAASIRERVKAAHPDAT